MAGEVTVDALPYIDHGYDDPGVRESALAMVEEECRRYRPTKNYLDHLPPLNTTAFETKMMTTEFERIQNRLPMETLSMKRYELPPPPAGRLSEVSAWQESIENSMAQLEHQWVRAMNLEIMLDYGIEAWKAYLEIFVALQAKAQTQLQDIKKQIQDVNWRRKQAQTDAGEKLQTLEANWVLLVSKNYEIEQQCVELEKQLQETRARIKQHEEEQEQQRLAVPNHDGQELNGAESNDAQGMDNDNDDEEAANDYNDGAANDYNDEAANDYNDENDYSDNRDHNQGNDHEDGDEV